MIVLEHTVPVALLAAATLLALSAGFYSAWRYLRLTPGTVALAALYAATLALLFWCLLIPGCRDTRTMLIKPRFVVAIDTSRSMHVHPEEQPDTRWDRALHALRMPWVEAVAAEAELELFAFDDGVRGRIAPGDLDAAAADGGSTRIRDSLRDLAGRYTGLNVAGLLLLSDGHDTREAFDDWAADPLPFPVYTVRLEDEGPWRQEPDLRVDGVTTPRRVISGRGSELRVAVSGQGTGDLPVTVQLFRDDALVDEQPTQIPDAGGRREVTFSLQHPEVGLFAYRVFLPPLPGETQVADNEHLLTIAVQDPRNRLLYVEGVPRFEYRFLRRVLMAEEQVTPVLFYSSADGTPVAGGPSGSVSADLTEQDLLQVKIVILGNLGAQELSEQRAANLVRYVEGGGSLVLLGGTRAWGDEGFLRTPLETLLPVHSHGTRVLEGTHPFETTLTPVARAHPAFAGEDDFWAVMPPVLTVFPDAEPKPGAEVLVTAETHQGEHPVLVVQRYGQGRVAAIFTDSLWRWQLTPETRQQPYARFWTQLISWMLPDLDEGEARRLDLFSDQDQIPIGESIGLSARFPDLPTQPDEVPDLQMTGPDGRSVRFPMQPRQVETPSGRSFPGFHLRYTPETPGSYSARAVQELGPERLESELMLFQVLPYSPETLPRPIREDLLQKLSNAGGGRHFEDLERMNRALLDLRFSVLEEHRSEFHSLWQRWPVLVLLMLLAAGMWVIRKARNMP